MPYGKKYLMSKLIRVAHLTSVHKRYDTRIFLKQCVSLAKNKEYFVTLIVADGKGNETLKNVQIIDVGKEKGRLSRFIFSNKKIFLKALNLNCDIYHLHDPELIPFGLKLKNKNKKVIFDSHEDITEDIMIKDWIPIYLRKIISTMYGIFEKKACSKFDMVIAATPFIQKKFSQKGIFSKSIKNFPINNEFTLHEIEWSQKKNEVCYIGSISEERGIIEIVKSLELLGDVKLNLGGSFSDNKLRDKCISLKGWSKVRELGFLDREQMDAVFLRSKAGLVVLHPTSTYLPSLPVKIFEYMAAGIPIICSNFELWDSMILKKYKCGLKINPLNPHDIAKAINTIINEKNMAEKMIIEGKKGIMNDFNWDNEEKQLYKVYKNI